MSRSSAFCLLPSAFCLLLLPGCRWGAPPVRIDPALAVLVPADTVIIGGARIDRLRETAAWKTYLAAAELPFLDEAAKTTGIDLRRDLWEVLVVSNGADTAAFARGSFAEEGMEPRIAPGMRRMPYKGRTLIGNDRIVVTFPNTSTAIAGRPSSVMWILDRRGGSTGPPKALADLVRSFTDTPQIWAVATGAAASALPAKGNAANVAKLLEMAETARGGVTVSDGAAAFVEARCATADAAKQLNDALGGLAALARALARDAEIKQALGGLQVVQEGRVVTAKLGLSADELTKILAADERR